MRAEHLGPLSLLLVAVAGWAVLVAVLALFGLGGYVPPLKLDPAQLPPIPRLAPAPPERLGPLSSYTAMQQRPLFYASRTPQPFYLSGEPGDGNAGFDFVLSSVLITPQLKLAILQPSAGGEGLRVREGEAPAGYPQWQLVELAPRSAVFDGPEGRRTLELRLYAGDAGVPPPAGAPVPGGGDMAPAPKSTGGPAPRQSVPVQPVPVPAQMAGQETTKSVSPAVPVAEPEVQTSAEQMDAIRKRIEERRRRLREQQGTPTGDSPAQNQ